MAAVKPPFVSMPGRAFWGLVVQKGPWKSTHSDYQRAHQVPGGTVGGGVPVGGTGEGKRDTVMTPYQQNGRGVLPEPSEHATQSIVRPGESWMIKKPPPGMKRSSKLKAALTIGKSNETDYEDIRHAKGMEPDMPPPPPDLKSTFLTEDRLSKSRNKNGLTVVTRNLPRYDIDSTNPVSQPPPSYSTGVPPSYSSSSGRPMDLDTPGIRTPMSGRSSMSIDILPGGGRRSSGGGVGPICGRGGDFSIPVCGVPAPSSGSPMSIDTNPFSDPTTPGTTMSIDTPSTPFTPPVIDQITSNAELDQALEQLKEQLQRRKLSLETSNLPPSRQAGIRLEGTALEPGSMGDVSSEFYPKEKRMMENAGGSGRQKKGKLTLIPKPRDDIITSREAEKMKRAAEAKSKRGTLKDKFAPSNVKPKRKPDTERVAGQKRRKRDPLKIEVTGLAPSKQSSTKSNQFKPKMKTVEDNSGPKQFDQVPDVRPKRKAAAKPPKGGVSKKTPPKKKK